MFLIIPLFPRPLVQGWASSLPVTDPRAPPVSLPPTWGTKKGMLGVLTLQVTSDTCQLKIWGSSWPSPWFLHLKIHPSWNEADHTHPLRCLNEGKSVMSFVGGNVAELGICAVRNICNFINLSIKRALCVPCAVRNIESKHFQIRGEFILILHPQICW